MHAVDILIIVAFIVYAVAAGLRARKVASQNLEEYFLAGRTLKGWQAGVSMAATQFAADTPLLVTGLIALGGIFAVWRLWVFCPRHSYCRRMSAKRVPGAEYTIVAAQDTPSSTWLRT